MEKSTQHKAQHQLILYSVSVYGTRWCREQKMLLLRLWLALLSKMLDLIGYFWTVGYLELVVCKHTVWFAIRHPSIPFWLICVPVTLVNISIWLLVIDYCPSLYPPAYRVPTPWYKLGFYAVNKTAWTYLYIDYFFLVTYQNTVCSKLAAENWEIVTLTVMLSFPMYIELLLLKLFLQDNSSRYRFLYTFYCMVFLIFFNLKC